MPGSRSGLWGPPLQTGGWSPQAKRGIAASRREKNRPETDPRTADNHATDPLTTDKRTTMSQVALRHDCFDGHMQVAREALAGAISFADQFLERARTLVVKAAEEEETRDAEAVGEAVKWDRVAEEVRSARHLPCSDEVSSEDVGTRPTSSPAGRAGEVREVGYADAPNPVAARTVPGGQYPTGSRRRTRDVRAQPPV
jgi:hypothetical protein